MRRKIKLSIIMVGFVLSGCGQQFGGEQIVIPQTKTPIDKTKVFDEKLKIKAENKEDILYSEVESYENDVKSYVYVSKIKAPKRKLNIGAKDLLDKYGKNKDVFGGTDEVVLTKAIDQPDEILDKRTYNSVTYKLGTTTEEKPLYQSDFYSGGAFYYDNPDWFYIEYATTTIEAWDLQLGIATGTSFWQEPLKLVYPFSILPAEAACGTSGDPCYAGAGDGFCDTSGLSSSWATNHAASASPAGRCLYGETQLRAFSYGDASKLIQRTYVPFNTASLPDVITVSAATLGLKVTATVYDNDNDGNDWVNVVQTSQASDTSLTEEDFDQCGAVTNPTEGCDTRVDITGISTGNWITFALNATGKGWIAPTGYTKLGIREGHDAINHEPTANYTGVYFLQSETTGTSDDPYLTITFTEGGASAAPLDGFKSSTIFID